MATDLNPLAVDMALINLGLAGIPAAVRHGNSLTDEVFKTFFTPAWWFARPYRGTPLAISDRDVVHMLRSTVPSLQNCETAERTARR